MVAGFIGFGALARLYGLGRGPVMNDQARILLSNPLPLSLLAPPIRHTELEISQRLEGFIYRRA